MAEHQQFSSYTHSPNRPSVSLITPLTHVSIYTSFVYSKSDGQTLARSHMSSRSCSHGLQLAFKLVLVTWTLIITFIHILSQLAHGDPLKLSLARSSSHGKCCSVSLRVPLGRTHQLQQPHRPPSRQGISSHTESFDLLVVPLDSTVTSSTLMQKSRHSWTNTTTNLLILLPLGQPGPAAGTQTTALKLFLTKQPGPAAGTQTTAHKLFLAKHILTHRLPLTAPTTAGTAREFDNSILMRCGNPTDPARNNSDSICPPRYSPLRDEPNVPAHPHNLYPLASPPDAAATLRRSQ